MTIQRAGWVNPTTVFVDFVSQYTADWLWQLYSNRTLVGSTRMPGERTVWGQLVASALPAPLTLVRVDADNILTDYGADLPTLPCNRYRLDWTAAGLAADTDHFDVVQGTVAGGAIDLTNIVARVPFTGDGAYSFELPPFEQSGAWAVGVVPRDDALPLGNAGTAVTGTATVTTPPADLSFPEGGPRFTVAIAAGVLTADFSWGDA